MAKKLLSLLRREPNGVHEAAILMGVFALFSQVFAVIRDWTLAHNFGASRVLDIYFAAFRTPDILFAGVASFMAAVVIVPILTKHAAESDEHAKKFLNDVFTIFFIILVLAAIGLFFAVPFVTKTFFHEFDAASQGNLIVVTRVLLLSPVFLGLSNLFSSVAQKLNRFFAFLLAPILYNFGIIAGAVFLYPAFGVVGIAWGAVFGAFLSFFVYFFISARDEFFLTLSFRPSFTDLWDVIRGAFPRAVSLLTSQLALFALIIFAAKMQEGSVTIFSFAFNLQSIPLLIIGTSYITAAFPIFSKHSFEDGGKKYVEQVINASRHLVFWLIPAFIFFVILRAQIVRVILGTGLFGYSAIRLTAAALAIFSLSIIAQSLGLLLLRGLHAVGDNVLPAIIGVLSSSVIVLFGYELISGYAHSLFLQNFIGILFRVDGAPGAQVLMLPLAYSAGMIINLILLVYLFKRRFGYSLFSELRDTFVVSSFASLLAGFVTYEFLVVLGIYLNLQTAKGIFFQGLIASLAGAITWWLVLVVFRNKDVEEIRHTLHRRLWKAGITIPDREEI